MRPPAFSVQFGARLLLVNLALLAPLATILIFFSHDKTAQINFRTAEMHGLDVEAPLAALLADFARVETAAPQAEQLRSVDRGFERLSEVAARYGVSLELDEGGLTAHGRHAVMPEALAQEWTTVKAALPGMAPAARDRVLRGLAVKVRELISHVGDTSKLILDPELDTFYLAELSVVAESDALLDLNDAVRAGASPDQLAMVTESAQLTLDGDHIRFSSERALFEGKMLSAGDRVVDETLGPSVKAFSEAVPVAVAALLRLAGDRTQADAQAEFKQRISAAIGATEDLGIAARGAMMQILARRVDGDRRMRGVGFLVAALALLLTGVASWAFSVDRQRLTAERAAARRELEEQMRVAALGRMASGIAHEIGNPLTVVLSKTQALIRSGLAADDDAERLASLRAIEAMAKKMRDIIVGLRTLSRKERNADLADVPIARIIKETLDVCVDKFRQNDVELRIDQVRDDVTIACRPVQIGQILTNLLTNAVDAVATQRDKFVHLSFEEHTDYVEFGVTDSGIGLTNEARGRLFEPFMTTKAPGKGTGLGLSIARALAESHGGALYFDGSSARTRFVMRIPHTQARPPIQSPREQNEVQVVVHRTEVRSSSAQPLILLVDDDDDVREATAKDLSQLGCEVVQARDGYEGVEVFRSKCDRIDLVLLDVAMPRLTGPEAFIAMQRIKSDLRVVFCTGMSTDDLPQEGIIGVIDKPFDYEELRKLLKRVLP